MRSAMAYRPVIGFLVHLLTHSSFILSRICRNRFANVVVSVAGPSSLTSFAISSAVVSCYPHVSWDPRYLYVCLSVLVKVCCIFHKYL